jgi:hypothetical protein
MPYVHPDPYNPTYSDPDERADTDVENGDDS